LDIDQWLKLAPTIAAAFFGGTTLWLGVKQHFEGNKSACREEYRFAKTFFDDLKDNPRMHSFARKKGFRALGQNHDLPPDVIEYLMTLKDPVTALSDYEFSRGYLKSIEGLGRQKLIFSNTFFFSSENRQKLIGVLYLFFAMLSYVVAFFPFLLFAAGNISSVSAIQISIIAFPFGIAATIFFVREFAKLYRARRLLKLQKSGLNEMDFDHLD
jgi:hypothetical protein